MLPGSFFYFDGEHIGHFGHFITEALSRLWCRDYIDLTGVPILTSHRFQRNFVTLLRPFGIQEKQILSVSQPVLVQKLLVSSQAFILDRTISRKIRGTYNKIANFYSAPNTPKRLYISRRDLNGQRALKNEREVEKLVKRLGYTVIHPQKLSLAKQVALFAGATDLIGPVGSGLYSALFSQSLKRIRILAPSTRMTLNDQLISAVTGVLGEYITGTPDNAEFSQTSPWVLNEELLTN